MPDFIINSSLNRHAGGLGSDGQRYTSPPPSTQFFASQLGSVFTLGRASSTVTETRDLGAHRFDLTSLDLSGLTVTRVRFQATSWFSGAVVDSTPSWPVPDTQQIGCYQGRRAYEQTYGALDLLAVKNQPGRLVTFVDLPALPDSTLWEIELDPAWIDLTMPTPKLHDLELVDETDWSVWPPGSWRYTIFQCKPMYIDARIIITAIVPPREVQVLGGGRQVFETLGGGRQAHQVVGGRRQAFQLEGGARQAHQVAGGGRQTHPLVGGRGPREQG